MKTLPGSRTLGRSRRQRGAALVLALLVLAILVVLVVQFAFSVKIEERIVKNTSDDAALELAARGARHIMAALFADDRKNGTPSGEIDTLADIWCDPNTEEQRTFQVGDVELVLVVEDLERRLPLPWLADEQLGDYAEAALARLITKLAPIQGVDGAVTAKAIRDKVTELESASANAAPGQPPSRRFYGLEQLLELGEALDRRILFGDPDVDPPTEGIAPYVTTWPVGQLNINTVFAPVLFAVLPEKNKEGASLHEKADEIVDKVREFRIDPDYVTTAGLGGGGPGEGQTGDQGASKSWAGKPFEKVDDLQSAEIHELLKSIFTNPQGQGANPNPSPSPSPTPAPGGGQGEGPDFKSLLTVQSKWFMVRVTATKSSQDANVDEEEEGAEPPSSEFRMLLFRNGQDEVTALYFAESPR